jgi:murein DD-endopeptidase MepM/ murein hydrolase activator NlpD
MRQDHARRGALAVLVPLAATLLSTGCSKIEVVLESVKPDLTPHESYLEALREAGLAETGLGRAWQELSQVSLHRATAVQPPYHESGYFAAERPGASAYRVDLKRGQSLFVAVEVKSAEPSRVFMDLFRPIASADDGSVEYRRLTGADADAAWFEFEPSRDGEYIIRLQPELLRSVRFEVSIRKSAALAFPVEGRDSRAIRSGFGAARDGGRRSHHGVDIFAPRGTPALAVADGEVVRVRTGGLGGRYIWVRDSKRGLSFYYAHLDRQLARTGQRVRTGDTLGLVGNTGNARTTPPHLHFGVYRRGEGPIDPYHFINELASDPPVLQVDTGSVGAWARTGRDGVLRQAAHASSEELASLDTHTMLRVEGGTGRWFRVALPDGRTGYVIGNLVEMPTPPLREQLVSAPQAVLEGPASIALTVDSVRAGDSVAVLGRFDDYLFVRASSGLAGWVGRAGS